MTLSLQAGVLNLSKKFITKARDRFISYFDFRIKEKTWQLKSPPEREREREETIWCKELTTAVNKLND